jgi:peroxiredoxin
MPIPSLQLPLGMRLPWFAVDDLDGQRWDTSKLREGRPVLVAFLCVHSPYVNHIESDLGPRLSSLPESGITVLAISSNDVVAYPTDSPEKMRDQVNRAGFGFPYCTDKEQLAAKAFKASCTPEFFVYDVDWRLVYHGQYDGSRPGNRIPVTGDDLCTAVTAACRDDVVPAEQEPSFGCSIKWRAGNEPEYAFTNA